jgi:cation transport regulator ChaC
MQRGPLWIFGYGSLVWRPDFAFEESRAGWIEGFSRRFWQGSTDHRGVPESPGRVATLVRETRARCWGTVYRVAPAERRAVLARLDYRERGGFVRDEVRVHLADAAESREPSVQALLYVAAPENPNYLGPAPLSQIAEQVQRSRGPSGPNVEYVLELAAALRAMRAEDDHVFALETLLLERSER